MTTLFTIFMTTTVVFSAPAPLSVPFTSQAPLGEWRDPRQQDGCEEAAALMAVAWARGQSLTPAKARQEIIAMSNWEKRRYGYYEDTSAKDTADRLIGQHLKHNAYDVYYDIEVANIRYEVEHGNAVLVPVNGRILKNPGYTPPGPSRHMILVIGYDPARDVFIAHDPGVRRGGGYAYPTARLSAALQDYPSGRHLPVKSKRTAMVIVRRN